MTTTLKKLSIAAAGAILLTLGVGKAAQAAVINFDSLSTGETVDDQFLDLGVDFNGSATVLTQGNGLNPAYPAYSPNNVVYNFPPTTIRIDAVGSLWQNVGAYITGSENITLTAYNSDNTVLGTASTGGSNFLDADTGLFPNIFLNIVAPNIAYVKFTDAGGDMGNSFTLDNFSFDKVDAFCPVH